MTVPRLRLRSPAWLRWPRRTARLRLTALCGGLFLVSGAALVAVTYVLFQRATKYRKPSLPKIPQTPAIEALRHLQLLPQLGLPQFAQPLLPLGQAQQGLANVVLELKGFPTKNQGLLARFPRLTQVQQQLAQDQRQLSQAGSQLARDQHKLAQAGYQLAQAVHQLAQTGPVEAAQRAVDSHQLLVNSGIALAIVAVLALLAGWLVAGRMLRPIRTITRTARRISSASLHERLALDGPQDEFKELGDTLDDLFGRLDAAFEAQRHFVANASHELRTPLTAERTLLQVALDDPDTTIAEWRSTAEEVLASSDEQARLLEALLTLASSESGFDGHEPIDLAATVAATLADLQPEVDRLGIHVDEVTTPALLYGNPLLVERLVANLLTNAVRHNIVGGRVEVVTEVTGGKAVLSVTNTGARIPPAEVDRLFQPFQRLDPRRAHYKDGHGLGLSIVRAIATAHQASINAHPMPDGGLSVRVVFPSSTDRDQDVSTNAETRPLAPSREGDSAQAGPPSESVVRPLDC
ncbi:MAG: HAMP domain-containing sensor histidine kinase [Acidimicrobiales bacterium]|jgi:signal transduction histidine kinase